MNGKNTKTIVFNLRGWTSAKRMEKDNQDSNKNNQIQCISQYSPNWITLLLPIPSIWSEWQKKEKRRGKKQNNCISKPTCRWVPLLSEGSAMRLRIHRRRVISTQRCSVHTSYKKLTVADRACNTSYIVCGHSMLWLGKRISTKSKCMQQPHSCAVASTCKCQIDFCALLAAAHWQFCFTGKLSLPIGVW